MCNDKSKKNNQQLIPVFDYCDYELLDSIGKSLIPQLIDSISINKKSPLMGYYDNKRSTFVDFQINNYEGIEYALKIEYILALNFLNNHYNEIEDSCLCAVPIYNFGIISRVNNDSVMYDTLSYSDMKDIQRIYREWWDANKNKSLDSLQKDWDNNIRPLDNDSSYCWK